MDYQSSVVDAIRPFKEILGTPDLHQQQLARLNPWPMIGQFPTQEFDVLLPKSRSGESCFQSNPVYDTCGKFKYIGRLFTSQAIARTTWRCNTETTAAKIKPHTFVCILGTISWTAVWGGRFTDSGCTGAAGCRLSYRPRGRRTLRVSGLLFQTSCRARSTYSLGCSWHNSSQ